MQKSWYDFHALKDIDENEQDFYRRILAYRKPYFMRYVYPQMSKEYTNYNKKSDRNAMRLFGKTVADLLSADRQTLTDAESEFIAGYQKNLPLGRGDCVMNKICYSFEDRFDSVKFRRLPGAFDYSILKSGASYSGYEYQRVAKLYEEYKSRVKSYMVHLQYEREDKYDVKSKISQINDEFFEECLKVCPNKNSLCDIILDIVYSTKAGKMFAWAICGDVMLDNLMNRFGYKLSFPVINDDGDIYYAGSRFELLTIDLEG